MSKTSYNTHPKNNPRNKRRIFYTQTSGFSGPIENNVRTSVENLSPPLYQTEAHPGIFQNHGSKYFVSSLGRLHLEICSPLYSHHSQKNHDCNRYHSCKLSSNIQFLFLWPKNTIRLQIPKSPSSH